MAGVRDRLIHHYFGISLDGVWEIVSVDLGEVTVQVERIVQELGGSSMPLGSLFGIQVVRKTRGELLDELPMARYTCLNKLTRVL